MVIRVTDEGSLSTSSRHFPEVEYTFKHALTQEVAYNSVLHGAAHEHCMSAPGSGDRGALSGTG